jgi:cytochrome c peroxidase
MKTKKLEAVLVGASTLSVIMAGSMLAAAQSGNIIVDPGEPDILPAFLFEPEVTFDSLKSVALWRELEQMLDDPYAIEQCNVEGNDQGYPSYCSTIRRRPSFLPAGCSYDSSTGLPRCRNNLLPQFLVHPLNYNPTTGEEFHLLNPDFEGVDDFAGMGPISPGADRIEEGEPAIDYNSPLVADEPQCIVLEGQELCGGDPGEPEGYSMPAVCGNNPITAFVESRPACLGNWGRLYDPERGVIDSLEKPTVDGNFAINSVARLAADPAALQPSNPSDYYRNINFATVLGKALFWDMQLGSDGVQSCGTCHFAGGIDTRTKNQLNPNHLGGDPDLEIFANRNNGTPPQDVNQDVVAGDFPLHKIANPDNPAEPGLDPQDVISDTDDVMSSMGVRFARFSDIPQPGAAAFAPVANGVRALLPDIGIDDPDPIPLFQGLRRVEPRNTPTMINAGFNFDNFWDGRARHDFNGGSVFGASDPQAHVYFNRANGTLVQTRQIIRFSSIASLLTGPALSEFEMSFLGRSWPKIGKKLLQGNGTAARPSVTPLANQLVSTSDSVLGPYSNRGGSFCQALGRPTGANRPGLCLTYRELVERSFRQRLWNNTTQHLNGTSAPCQPGALNGVVQPAGCDPFDGYTLAIAANASAAGNTNQFTQMEANFSLFAGLAVQAWIEVLVSDDTPFDRFMDANPDIFKNLGEAGEPGLVEDILLCSQTGNVQPCVRQMEGFVRTPAAGAPDPLLGMDLFFGSNLTLRNPDFRSARCGECHAAGNLTDHTFEASNQLSLGDFVAEFSTPGVEILIEPLGRSREISGFLLEAEINGNAQDAIERNMINQSIVPNPVDGLSYPDGAAFFDNGVYNLGVRPIAEDEMRGGLDPWGWPLSLATLMLKNLGGVNQQPNQAIAAFDPSFDPECAPECRTGGLFEESVQDQTINPGFEEEPAIARLPPWLAPWVNHVNVGDAHPEVDEVFGGLNTLMEVPIIEGFIDVLGPFNPAGVLNEGTNAADGPLMGTWPNVNRVGRMGSVKAPQLRNIELTGPYFHNGGKLTLRQVVDFYSRGGDFPITNAAHRDFNILTLSQDIQAQLSEAEKSALVDFLLKLTDERVAREQGPFDRPEVFVPIDGHAPRNTMGRPQMLTASTTNSVDCGNAPCFRQVTNVGAAGHANRLPSFLNVSRTRIAGPNNDHFDR